MTPSSQDVDGVIAQARAATLNQRGTFNYSNLGTALLGQALAAAARWTYDELVQQRIFGPLGMTASTVPVTAENLPERCTHRLQHRRQACTGLDPERVGSGRRHPLDRRGHGSVRAGTA